MKIKRSCNVTILRQNLKKVPKSRRSIKSKVERNEGARALNTKMKIYSYLILLISSFLHSFFFHEVKNAEDGWDRCFDIKSDLIIFIPDIQMYTSAEGNIRYLDAIMDKIPEFKSDLKSGNIFTFSAVSDFWMTGNTQMFQFRYN